MAQGGKVLEVALDFESIAYRAMHFSPILRPVNGNQHDVCSLMCAASTIKAHMQNPMAVS